MEKCQELATRFDTLKQDGLVDVKFYLRNTDEAVSEKVCAEVIRLHQAVERGDFAPLEFKDSTGKK
jgi:hypothetical protein